MYMYDDMMDIK